MPEKNSLYVSKSTAEKAGGCGGCGGCGGRNGSVWVVVLESAHTSFKLCATCADKLKQEFQR
jgi:hypothetical protein